MATQYVGKRPVLKGRSSNSIHTWKKKAGTYSNWDIFNTSHVLDGAPDRDVKPGAGNYPHDITTSRWFRGLDRGTVMDGAGSGARLAGHRFGPSTYKGLSGSAVFSPGYGHPGGRDTPYALQTTLKFRGVASARQLFNPGHLPRAPGTAGTANTFGTFAPLIYKGVSPQALAGAEGTRPAANAANAYGHGHMAEWFGVPSAKAL